MNARVWISRNLVALALTIGLSSAHAGYLFDTGAGNSQGGWALFNYTSTDAQSLGVTIHLSTPAVVHSIEAFMEGGTGVVDVTVVAGTSPVGAAVTNTAMTVASEDRDWRGVFGLSWVLAAGDYTLTFSVPGGASNYDGAIVGAAPNPLLGIEWFTYNSLNDWFAEDIEDLRLSLRISGERLSVPEPHPATLLLVSAAALLACRRRPTQAARCARD